MISFVVKRPCAWRKNGPRSSIFPLTGIVTTASQFCGSNLGSIRERGANGFLCRSLLALRRYTVRERDVDWHGNDTQTDNALRPLRRIELKLSTRGDVASAAADLVDSAIQAR